MASGPSLLESLKETNPGAVDSIKQVFNATAQFVSLPGQTSSFDTPSGSASATAEVTDLGIVGRGVKRSAPTTCVTSAINGQGNKENVPKKRSLAFKYVYECVYYIPQEQVACSVHTYIFAGKCKQSLRFPSLTVQFQCKGS